MDRFVKRRKPAPSSLSVATGSKNTSRASEEPLPKKLRVEKIKDSDEDDEDSSFIGYEMGDDDLHTDFIIKGGSVEGKVEADVDSNGEEPPPHRETAFEKCLPAIATDAGAIEEYETMRASQLSQSSQSDSKSPITAASRMETRQWVRGRSSIYVDAFNLALDTVLEDEAHLFNSKERRVFDDWRSLIYEAQYLLVTALTDAAWETDTPAGMYVFSCARLPCGTASSDSVPTTIFQTSGLPFQVYWSVEISQKTRTAII